MSLTIISVDTGNKNIKTPNTQPFNSGLICHGTSAPPLSAVSYTHLSPCGTPV